MGSNCPVVHLVAGLYLGVAERSALQFFCYSVPFKDVLTNPCTLFTETRGRQAPARWPDPACQAKSYGP